MKNQEDKKINIAIVTSEFNVEITNLMLERAIAHAKFLKVNVPIVTKVPGAFDLAIIIKELLERDDVDAVAALGAIVEGDTDHDELVGAHISRKVMDLALEYRKPVSFGISGPGMTRLQGLKRVDGYAKRAIESAVKLVNNINSIKNIKKIENFGKTIIVE